MPWLVAPGEQEEDDWDSERGVGDGGGGGGGDDDDDDDDALPCVAGQYVAGRVRVWEGNRA